MKVFILLSFAAVALATRECGENSHYESCGTACPLTCKNYNNPPKACVLMCNPGCHCDKGYVKTADGRCVAPEECPAQTDEVCGENQVFNGCGTACPLTCDNYQNPPKICTLQCMIGCECAKGFVKTRDGRCVRPEECPASGSNPLTPVECGENQVFKTCGTACPLTCDNYQNPPKFCTKQCVIGCACANGFVKTRDGRCVRPEECPASAASFSKCGENAHFEGCGTACPLTCRNYMNPPKFCVAMCKIGCQCDKGYVKTDDGQCVRPEKCPAETEEECGENQVLYTCGTACPLTCDNYQNPPKICTMQCVIGCACAQGFVKTRDGRCVRPEECPASTPEQKTCLGEAETGLCRGYFPMWYYDVKSEQCKKFIYGGCGGNGNKYSSEEECMDHCGDVLNESTGNICELPRDSGPCRALFRRFYFNKSTGMCEEFVYGGCKGNLNNFKTSEECEQTCVQAA